MRLSLLLILLIAPACSSQSERLVADAHKSGDWTAVNQRIQRDEERQTAELCGAGQQLSCRIDFAETRCSCIRTRPDDTRMRRLHRSRRFH